MDNGVGVGVGGEEVMMKSGRELHAYTVKNQTILVELGY